MSDETPTITVRLLKPHEHEGIVYAAGKLLKVDAPTRDFLAAHKVIEAPLAKPSTSDSQE